MHAFYVKSSLELSVFSEFVSCHTFNMLKCSKHLTPTLFISCLNLNKLCWHIVIVLLEYVTYSWYFKVHKYFVIFSLKARNLKEEQRASKMEHMIGLLENRNMQELVMKFLSDSCREWLQHLWGDPLFPSPLSLCFRLQDHRLWPNAVFPRTSVSGPTPYISNPIEVVEGLWDQRLLFDAVFSRTLVQLIFTWPRLWKLL